MPYLASILLGTIQGITEFLPISSTAHLILVEKFFKLEPRVFNLSFDAFLHLGTLLSALFYFRQDILLIGQKLIQSIKIKKIQTYEAKIGWYIILSTLLTGGCGFLVEDIIEQYFRNPILVAVFLFVFSLVFLIAEKMYKEKYQQVKNLKQGLAIGLSQAIALIPGASRSGITISAGLFLQLKRHEAARYAFLLSIPIIAGAGFKKLLNLLISTQSNQINLILLLGFICSFITGYFTIKFFLKYISQKNLIPFIIYRIILAGAVVLVYLL